MVPAAARTTTIVVAVGARSEAVGSTVVEPSSFRTALGCATCVAPAESAGGMKAEGASSGRHISQFGNSDGAGPAGQIQLIYIE